MSIKYTPTHAHAHARAHTHTCARVITNYDNLLRKREDSFKREYYLDCYVWGWGRGGEKT